MAAKFVSQNVYPGNPRLPQGSVYVKQDADGTHVYRNDSLKRWYKVWRTSKGWAVNTYTGDCGCGG